MSDPTARIATLAAEAIGLLLDALDQTTPENWDQPSNLDNWSVRELVAR